MNEERRRIANRYLAEIKNDNVVLPSFKEDYVPVWHIFGIRSDRREELEKYLNDNGVGTNKHYPIPGSLVKTGISGPRHIRILQMNDLDPGIF